MLYTFGKEPHEELELGCLEVDGAHGNGGGFSGEEDVRLFRSVHDKNMTPWIRYYMAHVVADNIYMLRRSNGNEEEIWGGG